jgi:hypothetical protein
VPQPARFEIALAVIRIDDTPAASSAMALMVRSRRRRSSSSVTAGENSVVKPR